MCLVTWSPLDLNVAQFSSMYVEFGGVKDGMIMDEYAADANAAVLRLPGGELVERERPISRSSISQRSEGWTVYGGTASSSSSSSSATGTCSSRPPSCCARHPRAAGCSRHRRAVSGATAQFSGTLTLRDDLFLIESASGLGAHHPPAVVRAYEACDGATALAQIRTVSNATLSARAQLAAAPLPIVAVIFFGTHYERLPLLRLYEPYFAQTVYMSPRAEIHSALRRTGGERAVAAPAAGSMSWDPWARALSYQCVHGLKATYACVADIGQRAFTALFRQQAREPQVGSSRAGDLEGSLAFPNLEGSLAGGGVLYFHFDLWVQPWRMLAHDSASARASRLASLWSLPSGRIHLKQAGPTHLMPLECFNASASATYARRHPQWTWACAHHGALPFPTGTRGAIRSGRGHVMYPPLSTGCNEPVGKVLATRTGCVWAGPICTTSPRAT